MLSCGGIASWAASGLLEACGARDVELGVGRMALGLLRVSVLAWGSVTSKVGRFSVLQPSKTTRIRYDSGSEDVREICQIVGYAVTSKGATQSMSSRRIILWSLSGTS